MESSTRIKCNHIFKENINRVWVCLRNTTLSSLIDPSFVTKSIITKGNNSWTLDSEYTSNWIGISKYTSKCVEVISKCNYKKISWILTLSIGISCQKTYNFYEITHDDSTLVTCEVIQLFKDENDSVPNFEERMFYFNLFQNQLLRSDKYLKDHPIELYNYESCLIKKDFKFLWEFATNMNKTAEISPMIGKQFEYNGDPYEPGTFIKGYNSPYRKVVYFKVMNVIKDPMASCWSYVIQPFGTTSIFPKQSIEICVTKIDNEESQVSFLHSFHEPVLRDTMSIISKDKRNFLAKLKQYCQDVDGSSNSTTLNSI